MDPKADDQRSLWFHGSRAVTNVQAPPMSGRVHQDGSKALLTHDKKSNLLTSWITLLDDQRI
jgi:hypothetical protein